MSDDREEWLLHPYTEQVRKDLRKQVELAQADLNDCARGSADPKVSAASAKLEVLERHYERFIHGVAFAARKGVVQ